MVLNATPVVREKYIVGVPAGGLYKEVLNTDFDQLQAGTYSITRGSTSTYLPGVATAGTDGGVAGSLVVSSIFLQAGQAAIGYDFTGYVTIKSFSLFNFLTNTNGNPLANLLPAGSGSGATAGAKAQAKGKA